MERTRSTACFGLVLLLAACGGSSPDDAAGDASSDAGANAAGGAAPTAAAGNASPQNRGAPLVTALVPLPGREDSAPTITRVTNVLFRTTAGDITIAVYPEAAPNAAAQFVELVESGFYDNTPVSRVVDGFVAQFGVNWRAPHSGWRQRTFRDDPSLFKLERGTLAFAKTSAPNSASTQVFINFEDNSWLADPPNNFTTFGMVVSGMELVDGFARVGDPSGGLDQARLWANGDAYLATLDEQPTMIVSAKVL